MHMCGQQAMIQNMHYKYELYTYTLSKCWCPFSKWYDVPMLEVLPQTPRQNVEFWYGQNHKLQDSKHNDICLIRILELLHYGMQNGLKMKLNIEYLAFLMHNA